MKLPLVSQIHWPAVLFQIALVVGLAWLLPPFIGVFAYVAYSQISPRIWCRYHIQGIRLMRAEKFQDALGCFERSDGYFQRHAWIDRYRFFILLSSSALSYREMALCNIGFCHSQLGNVPAAREAYSKVLELFPKNAIATVFIRMFEAGKAGQV